MASSALSNPEVADQFVSELNSEDIASHLQNVDQVDNKAERQREFEQMMNERMQRYQQANLYVKNLDSSIDDERLREEFSPFGTITSAKVMINDHGKSKGFGFVCFKKPEAAERAMNEFNGKIVAGRSLYVCQAQNKAEKQCEFEQMMNERINRYRKINLYVKNLDHTIDDERLREEFSPFGTITSAKVMLDDCGKSKEFGFVCFKEPKAAERAMNELNGKDIAGRLLYVGQAQKKAERQHKLEQMKIERKNHYHGENLYVKNLDDSIDDERLHQEFSQFGTITSAKVTMEEGRSKRFGFVCFSSPKEAAKALTTMNGRVIGSKPLYVALAQCKEDRKAHLAAQRIQRLTGTSMQQVGQVLEPGSSDNNAPIMPQSQCNFVPVQMLQVGPRPRWPTTQMPQGGPRPGWPPAQMLQLSPRPRWPPAQMPQLGPRPGLPPAQIPQLGPRPGWPPVQMPQADPRPGWPPAQMPQLGPRPGWPPVQMPQLGPRPGWPPVQMPQGDPRPGWPPAQMPQLGPRPGWLPVQMRQVSHRPRWPLKQQQPPGGQENSSCSAQVMFLAPNDQGLASQQPTHITRVSGTQLSVSQTTTEMPSPMLPTFNYTATMKNSPQMVVLPQQSVHQVHQPAVNDSDHEPLTATMLAAVQMSEQEQMLNERLFPLKLATAQPSNQKQMLRERLLPLVQSMHTELAEKITQMLLDIDNFELLQMMEDQETLKFLVEQAVAVLQDQELSDT